MVKYLFVSILFIWGCSSNKKKGEALLKERNYKIAISLYNIEIDENPSAQLYFERGYSKFKLGDIVGSTKDFDKAIELNSNFTKAYFYKYLITNDFNKSYIIRKETISKFPTSPEGLYLIALENLDNVDIIDFNIDYENVKPILYPYKELKESKLYVKIINLLEQSVSKDSTFSYAYGLMGYLSGKTFFDYNEAINKCNKAIELDLDNVQLLLQRAEIYNLYKQYHKELNDLNTVNKLFLTPKEKSYVERKIKSCTEKIKTTDS
jgi:tetratricopeptide (TPR) repeat protein